MGLAAEYHRQFAWRSWPAIFAHLPCLDGQAVLDLGCGAGDLAAELCARGARVIGLDGNEALLQAAREKRLPDADFRAVDLRGPIDGVP